VQAFSAVNLSLIVVRREHPAASSNAVVLLQRPANSLAARAPSILRARLWAADRVAPVDPEHVPDLEQGLDLADLRARALVAHDPVHLVAHRRPQKPDVQCVLHHAVVRVVSSSTPRLKKGR